MAAAATILSSCPLRDVLAILILLLQLPPTVLTLVHFLFATLTLLPPQAGAPLSVFSAVPSLTDIFQGAGGTPSLFTVFVVDVFILLLWLLLWVPVQNFVLDLAQAVIAISLGGAAAGNNGTTNSTFMCVVIILSDHLFRTRSVRQHVLRLLGPGLERMGLGTLAASQSLLASPEPASAPPGWPRTVLGIHIFAQGVIRIIRRSLSRREASHAALPTSKRVDPEAAVQQPMRRSSSISKDNGAEPTGSLAADSRKSAHSPALQTPRERSGLNRQKRKQITHVRSQQPFWAALASTKVTVLKEMETNLAANDAADANMEDNSLIGNALQRSEDRVWFTHIEPTDIAFRAQVGATESGLASAVDSQDDASKRTYHRKPFYVRINGASWSSTQISASPSLGYLGDETTAWAGKICGLTALSNYLCEFVRAVDDEVFYSASITTPADETSALQGRPGCTMTMRYLRLVSASNPSTRQPLRPLSPSTTLMNSIATANQTLQDLRQQQKRNRKEHKAALGTLNKDVETYTRQASNTESEDRQRQRQLQLTQNIRSAEQAAANFAHQNDSLETVPSSETEDAREAKAEWEREQEGNQRLTDELEKAKSEAVSQKSQLQTDIAAVVQKRERLNQRLSKLSGHHQDLVMAHTDSIARKNQKQRERGRKTQDRAAQEQHMVTAIADVERSTQEIRQSTAQVHHAMQQHEAAILQAQQQHSFSATGRGSLPADMNGNSHPSTPFASFQFPSLKRQASSTPANPVSTGRHRSSSLLSNVSGFTDALDDPFSPSPSVHAHHGTASGPLASARDVAVGIGVASSAINWRERSNGALGPSSGSVWREGSNGTGSGSSGASSQGSSQRDPMSPLPHAKAVMLKKGSGVPTGTGRLGANGHG